MSAPVTYASIADLDAAVGDEVGPSDWLTIDQHRMDEFVDATRQAADGPFGTTIAHGFLTVSLVPYFNARLRRLENVRMGVNYGLNRVRFPAPVPVGSRLRGRLTLIECDRLPDAVAAVQLVTRATIEVEGAAKPACVAELVSRYYFDE